ncbi:MAG: DUF89 family protein [Thermotogaceae bacterium]|nr:DUF89 family protein [Thermotogaceae bacterium]
MKADARCLICTANQALRVLNKHIRSEEEKWIRLQDMMKVISGFKWGLKPIEMGEILYSEIEKIIGKRDIYEKEKRRSNEIALSILDKIEKAVRDSADPLYDASKLAIAGNLIDLGAPSWDEERVYNKILEILEKPFGINDYETFKKELSNATSVLFIVDNSGEIVFDRLFIEMIKEYNPSVQIFVAAKSKPIINDATVQEAEEIMNGIATVIDSGMTIPGTIVEKSSEIFRELFFESDIVVSKGQGNFEGLNEEENEKLYFLLTIKCPVVADFLRLPEGTMVFMKNTKKR